MYMQGMALILMIKLLVASSLHLSTSTHAGLNCVDPIDSMSNSYVVSHSTRMMPVTLVVEFKIGLHILSVNNINLVGHPHSLVPTGPHFEWLL